MTDGKIYYKIGEVAKEFNLTYATLRYWEKEFRNLKPETNKRGVRLYRRKDIELIRQIVFLTKDKGFSIAGAKKELASYDSNETNNEILNTLLETKHFLEQLKQNLI